MPAKSTQEAKIIPRDSSALRDLVALVRPAVIVEFGSWEGRSAVTFLLEAKILGLRSKIVCVDTWLGSAEHWQGLFSEGSEWSFGRLKVENGEPQVLRTFWQTIRDHGCSEETSIVRASTTHATPFLKQSGLKPELVYVDADHSFLGVLKDLRLAGSLTKDGGVIAGDDFESTRVRLAVAWFALSGGAVLTSLSQFVILNTDQRGLRKSFLDRGWKIERFSLLSGLTFFFWSLALKARRKVLDGLQAATK